MLALVILEGVVLALLAVIVVGLLRSHAEILRRLHDLGADAYGDDRGAEPAIRTQPGVAEPRPSATAAFDVEGTTPSGSAVVVGVVDRPHTTLLAFLSSGCLTCGNFWDAFRQGAGQTLPGRDTHLVVVTKGPEAESLSAVRALAEGPAKTVMSSQAWTDYQVPVSPYFVLADGATGQVVGEGSGTTWAQVSSLLDQACADAGLDPTPSRPDPGRRRRSRGPSRMTGPERERRADDELRAAGIGPGHPSLYGQAETDPAATPSSAPSSATTEPADPSTDSTPR
jgi:hypothetical protein